MGAFLGLFLLIGALGVPLLEHPDLSLRHDDAATAGLGVGLLIADVVAPVPSSVVMVALGALYGVIGGTLLSTVGGLGAALSGYLIGRLTGPKGRSLASPAAWARADAFFQRWGAFAILMSRPVPIVAETVAVLAGMSRARPGRVTLAALFGSLPVAAMYAFIGNAAVESSLAALLAVVALGALALWVFRSGTNALRPQRDPRDDPDAQSRRPAPTSR